MSMVGSVLAGWIQNILTDFYFFTDKLDLFTVLGGAISNEHCSYRN